MRVASPTSQSPRSTISREVFVCLALTLTAIRQVHPKVLHQVEYPGLR